jgi:hypothetical protein
MAPLKFLYRRHCDVRKSRSFAGIGATDMARHGTLIQKWKRVAKMGDIDWRDRSNRNFLASLLMKCKLPTSDRVTANQASLVAECKLLEATGLQLTRRGGSNQLVTSEPLGT